MILYVAIVIKLSRPAWPGNAWLLRNASSLDARGSGFISSMDTVVSWYGPVYRHGRDQALDVSSGRPEVRQFAEFAGPSTAKKHGRHDQTTTQHRQAFIRYLPEYTRTARPILISPLTFLSAILSILTLTCSIHR